MRSGTIFIDPTPMITGVELENLRIQHGLSHEQMRFILDQAIRRFLEEPNQVVKWKGLGQELLPAPAEIIAVQQAVSPWLWILSIFSFGMALMNTKRISTMYGSWKKARAALR